MKRRCACACCRGEAPEAEEGSTLCRDCREAEAELEVYWLARERTARSIIEGFVELGERGKRWLEEW